MSGLRREIVQAGGREIYVLHFPGRGAMTYEAHIAGEHASVNHHWLTNPGCSTQSPDGCEFLGGDRCWFDGTSLARQPEDEEGIWKLLASWAPS